MVKVIDLPMVQMARTSSLFFAFFKGGNILGIIFFFLKVIPYYTSSILSPLNSLLLINPQHHGILKRGFSNE
jgi:hypothetical protein